MNIRKMLLAAGVAMIGSMAVVTTESYAEDTYTTDEVIGSICAGMAVDIELDTMPSQEQIDAIIEENYAWMNPGALVMAHATDEVNIRESATTDSEIVGKLYSNCGGYIIEYTDTWTKIKSGNAEGWVCNDYLYFGSEAQDIADDIGNYWATVTASELNVRSESNTESDVLGTVNTGDVFEVVSNEDGWVAVDYEGKDGFISADYVSIEFHITYGESMEEIAAREAAEKQAALEAERYQYYGVYAASATDVELLAAIIQCEAGYECYEGQVAVGAVVMNRVRSAAFPNTIYGVIYAPGQFTPAGAGLVDKRLANGLSASCLQAAQEALSGYSNVGAALYFRRTGSHEGLVVGNHVFW